MKSVLERVFALITTSGNLSVGRVLLLSCFILAMIRWAGGHDIVGTQLTVLLTLIGYVFGTKVLDNVTGKDAPSDPNGKGA